MALIKSYSVGNGDLYCIRHGSDNMTIIDCNLIAEREKEIIEELIDMRRSNDIHRFISTHPDEDHIHGLSKIDEVGLAWNFYCVHNEVSKEDESESFKRYKSLRDGDRAYYIEKNCSRKWMNIGDEVRGSSGISVLWPDLENENFKQELKRANDTGEPNNISPAITYSMKHGVTALWLGDMGHDYMESIYADIDLVPVDILFAPHHGRQSGRVPSTWLKDLNPKLIVVGEAPSDELEYYSNYNTLKQNSAGDIAFDCHGTTVDVHVSNATYSESFLKKQDVDSLSGMKYIGSFDVC